MVGGSVIGRLAVGGFNKTQQIFLLQLQILVLPY